MASGNSEVPAGGYVAQTVKQSVKILVVGHFGVGKTTLIGSVSEIMPLRTEELMTASSIGVDSLAGLDHKRTTTVALDFGRITINPEIVLYLFGTPGQRRFWNLWEGLSEGAVGALVIIDTRRLQDCFEVLDQLELRGGTPFAVVVNQFPDSPNYDAVKLRQALDLLPDTPIVFSDARDRQSSVAALITLVEYALTSASSKETV